MRPNEIDLILEENDRRNARMFAKFNPISGEGSIGERVLLEIDDFPIRRQWIPKAMLQVPLVKMLAKAGTVRALLEKLSDDDSTDFGYEKFVEQFVRVRSRFDFPFWAASLVYIKNKDVDGMPEILFRLSYPQRLLVQRLEQLRIGGKPIRLVLLKARQWGGSTTIQLYMAWLQLCHRQGLNSLIIAHQGAATDEIKDMFDRMIKAYPLSLLHALNETYAENEPKMVGVGKSGSIFRVPQRNCKVKIGTAERPDSCRGGDYALVHLSEVGLWKATDGKKPEGIVRSACGGVLYKPLTMIVYESTANGMGNFFHKEYLGASKGETQFGALFIAWFQIDWNRKTFSSEADRSDFARRLYENRLNQNAMSDREEPGRYLWWLWEKGATLEAINWYIIERTKHQWHGSMASECPSDDIEAFVNSGAAVFDKYHVEKFRKDCRPPRFVGEVYAFADEGEDALRDLKFKEDKQGQLWIWSKPDSYDPCDTEDVTDRYLVVVDVGGRSNKADWSVIVVFDRLYMIDGGKPFVAAQWYGHTDIDILAWKAAQIAAYYSDALLVIESNTLETHDRQRLLDGDQSHFILNQLAGIYPNLYARKQSEEDIRQGAPRKYGFHTNVATKPMIISSLIKVIRDGLYEERDERCLKEYVSYERKANGAFGAIDGEHDDLLMTRAIGLHICFHEMEPPRVVVRGGKKTALQQKVVSAATI